MQACLLSCPQVPRMTMKLEGDMQEKRAPNHSAIYPKVYHSLYRQEEKVPACAVDEAVLDMATDYKKSKAKRERERKGRREGISL